MHIEGAAEKLQRMILHKRRLLVLQNPGRGSRNYLAGIIAALRKMNVAHCVLDMQEIWAINKTDPATLVQRLSQILIQQQIGAVLGYGFNGMADVPLDDSPLKNMRSFFEIRGIPHLMLWLDHPQWHTEHYGLAPEIQGMFRSANCVHLLKSAAHALEMERMVGWPNCFELAAGVDPEQFPLATESELSGGVDAEFDLVAICSEGGVMPTWLQKFVTMDAPDPAEIRRDLLPAILKALEGLCAAEIPPGLRAEATAMGIRWAGMKEASPFLAAARHWPALTMEFPGVCWFLTLAYPTYMKATRILWRLREWERRFYMAYLARYFKVGVFGGDWSAIGLGPGGWVDFLKQSAVYARGKVALDITDGHDEEGLTLKPFEIAASGVAMLHYEAEGLRECFAEDREIAIFKTPQEARDKLGALVNNRHKRQAMAQAARQRVLADHTWEQRMAAAFKLARLDIAAFRWAQG